MKYSRSDMIFCLVLGVLVGAIVALPFGIGRGSKVGFDAGYALAEIERPAGANAENAAPYATLALDDLMALDGAVVLASFYAYESGTHTANGERYDPLGFTAAHRALPFNTFILAENLDNGRYATLRVNDRGPARRLHRRGIDVSLGVARELGMIERGLAPLRLRVIGRPGMIVDARASKGD